MPNTRVGIRDTQVGIKNPHACMKDTQVGIRNTQISIKDTFPTLMLNSWTLNANDTFILTWGNFSNNWLITAQGAYYVGRCGGTYINRYPD